MRARIIYALVGHAVLFAGARNASAGDTSGPRDALLRNPVGVSEVADTSYEIRWFDSNLPAMTGTASIDLFYTRTAPPTFVPGQITPTLTGTAIVMGIREEDRTNSHLWDTTSVPSGVYWLWSFAHLRPIPPPPWVEIIELSPGVLSIVHPGDERDPAIVLTSPQSPVDSADQRYTIRPSIPTEAASFASKRRNRVTARR
jgi:hypothetical protein